MMEFAIASGIGVLVFAAVYLLLRARSFDVILGLTLLSYAANLLIFAGGRLTVGKPPVMLDGLPASLDNYTDPLPQALVLTAIVIAFAMTAVMIVLAMRSRADNDSDHVDAGDVPAASPAAPVDDHAPSADAVPDADRRRS